MKQFNKQATSLLLAAGMGLAATAWAADTLQDVLKARGLSQQDLLAAAKTYVPTGKRDEFVAFSSGGQSGQVIVYAIPSMRILKYIGVFTPEPWQGYGFDESSKNVLKQGRIDGKDITWGDTHHPAISETNGEYDGQFLFINDKANPRLAVIDLRDFETKQIVVNPIFKSEHGGAFVSSNTEYVIEAAQYASPLENKKFFPLEEFNEKYRGGVTYWKFDRKEGRIDTEEVVLARTAALLAGSVRLRQGSVRRLVVHQLVLLRALRRRHREGSPAV
jgi:nitrous-oxide reductase